MRRMISESELNNIKTDVKKLSDNIVINDAGTLVEIGGNVAVESIEQIGYVDVQTLYIHTGMDVTFSSTAETLGTGEVVSYDGSLSTADIGTPFFEDYEVGKIKDGYGVIFWVDANGNKVYTASLGGKTLITTGALSGTQFTATEEELVQSSYKPFFTEEQYAAILELIENE